MASVQLQRPISEDQTNLQSNQVQKPCDCEEANKLQSNQVQNPCDVANKLQSNQVQKPCEEANKLQSSPKCGEQNAGSKMKVVTMEMMKEMKERMHLQHHANQTQQHQSLSHTHVVQAEHQIKHDSICSKDGKTGHVSEKAKKDKTLKKEKGEFLGKKNEQGHFTLCKSPKTKDKKEKKDKKKKKKNKDKDDGTSSSSSSSSSSESDDDAHEKKKKQDKEKKKHK
ncbi:hypothetical protein BVC80_9001g22 [Macleaya cordata]|uniref:Uncharacterized protein n=1 Tax=Macleaya cordata TaxID=56857 RepID=A0A200QLS0_MACCD|nr:hypothetical protein BVC80_9001g22 [Macleaya cordata]